MFVESTEYKNRLLQSTFFFKRNTYFTHAFWIEAHTVWEEKKIKTYGKLVFGNEIQMELLVR